MTRDEHLQWAKRRALEILDSGDLQEAFASMMSDLCKHDELRNHSAIALGMMMLMNGHLASDQKMRDFITGFR